MPFSTHPAQEFITSMELKSGQDINYNSFPFNLPVVKSLSTPLKFNSKVTFIIGENGSGKSTLLEALAVTLGLNPEGGSENFNFSTRKSHSDLHEYLVSD